MKSTDSLQIKAVLGSILYYVAVAAIGFAALALFGGCATVDPEPAATTGWSAEVHAEPNPYTSPVVRDTGNTLEIVKPPELKFTGKKISGAKIREWAESEGIHAEGVFADSLYAQLESESAIRLAHWLKRALHDLDYTYYADARDCDNFARIFRAFPDFFTDDDGAQALVFGIYAKMKEPFAGVRDGFHALNVAWTDRGVPVFEPQGWRELVYQDIRAWPSRSGITNAFSD